MTMTSSTQAQAAMPIPAPPLHEVDDPDFKMNLAINDQANVLVFHTKQFRKKLSWLEFDLNTNKLDFVLNDGDVRNFGILVDPALKKYMQNSFQVLMVLTNPTTGEAIEGNYFPLVIHRA